jgi:hypothetical protein
MKAFWVYGEYVSSAGIKRLQRSEVGHYILELGEWDECPRQDRLPLAKMFLAGSEQEAIEQAERFISHAGDCLWLAGPHVEQASEEQNMRLLGFPLLPGFESC